MFRRFLTGSLLCSAAWIASAVPVQQESVPGSAAQNSAPALSEALSLFRNGSLDLALAKYNDILKTNPHSGEAYAGIIRCHLKQDKVREADDALQKALHADPSNADLKVAEGELLFRQGEIPEAGAVFDDVLSTPPDPVHPNATPNARAYLGAARVAGANAMHAREHILLRRAHALDASDPDIQKLWMDTLSVEERIQSLQDYLAKPNNDDEDTRRNLRERLDFLKVARKVNAGRCRPVSDVTATKTTLASIPLSNEGGSQGSGLDVEINGKPSRLLLDTGTSGILISSKAASLAGLKAAADVRMGGIGDRADATAHAAWAESVRIGEMEFHNCPLYIVDRLPSTADGIIGTDVFSNFLIDIDFPASTLRLSPLPPRPGETPVKASLSSGEDASPEPTPQPRPLYEDRDIAPEMHAYVQAFRIGHYLLIPTTVDEKEQKLFLLDTGSFDNTIDTSAAQQVTKIHRAPRIDVKGMNGSVKKVYVADHITLDFGHLRQTVPDMVAIDMSNISRQVGTEISGSLGMVMLHLLKIRLNYRDALADFQYAPKPPRR